MTAGRRPAAARPGMAAGRGGGPYFPPTTRARAGDPGTSSSSTRSAADRFDRSTATVTA